jgi:hypothetical protein
MRPFDPAATWVAPTFAGTSDRPQPLAPTQLSTAIRSGLPMPASNGHPCAMGTKSRESIYGSSIRASAERAKEARKEADRLACEAWN